MTPDMQEKEEGRDQVDAAAANDLRRKREREKLRGGLVARVRVCVGFFSLSFLFFVLAVSVCLFGNFSLFPSSLFLSISNRLMPLLARSMDGLARRASAQRRLGARRKKIHHISLLLWPFSVRRQRHKHTHTTQFINHFSKGRKLPDNAKQERKGGGGGEKTSYTSLCLFPAA